MIFRSFPINDAEGVVLAHTARAEGLKIPKGSILSKNHLNQLKNAEVSSVYGAKLQDNDVEENHAAHLVAHAMTGDSLRLGKAHHGRTNIHAADHGILKYDPQRLLAVNRVDESVTAALLPNYSRVSHGRMVATVKIIPFSAPKKAVSAAAQLASQPNPLLQIHPFQPLNAAFLVASLPHIQTPSLPKTRQLLQQRLLSVGGAVQHDAETPQHPEPLAQALSSLSKSHNLILIHGASAIADRRDAVPDAVVRAGGAVIRFGAPTDPGNLLMLATLNNSYVIGLPGCARSPSYNGLDIILERLAARIPVSSDDIAAMGEGGLLLSPPERSAPTPSQSPTPSIAAVVLAAGQSRRASPHNKLLTPVQNEPLVRRVVQQALLSNASPVIVVVQPNDPHVPKALNNLNVQLVQNPAHAEGVASSIRAAIHAVPDHSHGALVILADMPDITHKHINRLVSAFNPEQGRSVCAPSVRGRRGNPVLFARSHFDALSRLRGDVGAKALLPHINVTNVPFDDDAPLIDADSPDELLALQKRT